MSEIRVLANTRPNASTNSLTFIACHLVNSRHFMAACLRIETVNPFAEPLGGVDSIERAGELPVGFLVQHESYHIGQMALLRKSLGHPAMRYS